MRIFTRVEGKLAMWQVPEDMTLDEALVSVRRELGSKHTATILTLVKY